MVRSDRTLFFNIASHEIRKISDSRMAHLPGFFGVVFAVMDDGVDTAILKVDGSYRVFSHDGIMGDNDDGAALFVKFLQYFHDLLT
jgi:hypothetical protein